MKQASSNQKRPHRPAVSYRKIVGALRNEILSGKFQPGEQLPPNVVLQKHFATTPVTVQRAVQELVREGFIEARPRRGIFVAKHPPHLNHYALIFQYDPGDLEPGGWSHFYAVLANEATNIQQSGKRLIECFYGIDGRTENANYQRLLSKLKAYQFAGLIFAAAPHWLMGTPLLEREGVPRVGLMSGSSYAKIPAVEFDHARWFEKALDHLASRGRKRIAFVSKSAPRSMVEVECPPALLTARGLISRPYWNLVLPVWSPGAQHGVQLLMQGREEPPDALVITDDNVVEPTMAGLMAAGVRVPDDVEVVAHANFPRSGPRTLPLKWLGYDNHQALQICLAVIDQQCRGETPLLKTKIVPVFEEELETKKVEVESVESR